MRRLYLTLAAAVLALSACDTSRVEYKGSSPSGTKLIGVPHSVETNGGHSSSNLTAVIQQEDGKYILAWGKASDSSGPIKAAAVIQSEINDKDESYADSTVELKGSYSNDGVFKIDTVTANDITVTLE